VTPGTFFKGDWANALADFRRECELSERGQDYPRLYIWQTRSHLGKMDAANKEFADYLEKRPNATRSDWVSRVAGHLLGKVSETDLFAAAKSPDAKKERGQLCEAWFYSGIKKLLSGDRMSTADRFKKCLATEKKTFTEYEFAQAELKALGL
jgi:lipoprotein NlpI